jgi:hypothetical protein
MTPNPTTPPADTAPEEPSAAVSDPADAAATLQRFNREKKAGARSGNGGRSAATIPDWQVFNDSQVFAFRAGSQEVRLPLRALGRKSFARWSELVFGYWPQIIVAAAVANPDPAKLDIPKTGAVLASMLYAAELAQWEADCAAAKEAGTPQPPQPAQIHLSAEQLEQQFHALATYAVGDSGPEFWQPIEEAVGLMLAAEGWTPEEVTAVFDDFPISALRPLLSFMLRVNGGFPGDISERF